MSAARGDNAALACVSGSDPGITDVLAGGVGPPKPPFPRSNSVWRRVQYRPPSATSAIWRSSSSTAPRPSPRSVRLIRSEEHTSELQSLMRSSYAVFCVKKIMLQHYTHILQYQTI